jgi:hypothetical protein
MSYLIVALVVSLLVLVVHLLRVVSARNGAIDRLLELTEALIAPALDIGTDNGSVCLPECQASPEFACIPECISSHEVTEHECSICFSTYTQVGPAYGHPSWCSDCQPVAPF